MDVAINLIQKKHKEKQRLCDLIGEKRGRRQTVEENEEGLVAVKIYNILKTKNVTPLGYCGALLLWYFG